jgi:hypothetical protein
MLGKLEDTLAIAECDTPVLIEPLEGEAPFGSEPLVLVMVVQQS